MWFINSFFHPNLVSHFFAQFFFRFDTINFAQSLMLSSRSLPFFCVDFYSFHFYCFAFLLIPSGVSITRRMRLKVEREIFMLEMRTKFERSNSFLHLSRSKVSVLLDSLMLLRWMWTACTEDADHSLLLCGHWSRRRSTPRLCVWSSSLWTLVWQ